MDGRRIGWDEGFQQGLLEGNRLGSRIGCCLVPLLSITAYAQSKAEFKQNAQELIEVLSTVSLRNEEDPEGKRDQVLSAVEAKTKALTANFLKQHPQLPETEKRRLKTGHVANNNNKVIDLF